MVSASSLLFVLAFLAATTVLSAQTDTQNVFIEALDQLIEAKVNDTLLRTLDTELESRVGDILANEPVIRTIDVTMLPDRSLVVRLPTGQRVTISLSNPSAAVTSSNNLLAYRPRYADIHNSGFVALFLNMEGIFPCLTSGTGSLRCGLLTLEEDGFLQGNVFLQAMDPGNDFHIFSSTENIATYGLAVRDCSQLNSECFPDFAQISIFCLLPRPRCG